MPVFNLVVVFSDGGLYLLDAQPDAQGLLLQCVLLLLQALYLLQHPLVLILHLRKCSLEREKNSRTWPVTGITYSSFRSGDCTELQQKTDIFTKSYQEIVQDFQILHIKNYKNQVQTPFNNDTIGFISSEMIK